MNYIIISTLQMKRKIELQKEIARIRALIVEKYKPEKIIIFGSMATGNVHENSDIDIVIIKNTKKRFLDRTLQVSQITKNKLACDFLIYTPSEFKTLTKERSFFSNETLDKGKVIYDKFRYCNKT